MAEVESTVSYRVKRLEERIDDLESKNSTAHQRFYDRFEEMGKKMAVSEDRYSTLLVVMGEIKTDVSAIKEKPSKRWESVIAAIIAAVVTAIITMALNGKL